jgi:hypothetical protein
MRLDCGSCAIRESEHCEDCVVSALVEPPQGAVVLDVEEERALRALARAGLIPGRRLGGGRAPAVRLGTGMPVSG